MSGKAGDPAPAEADFVDRPLRVGTRAMHVFCDESGGSDPSNDVFLIAAVAVSGAHATRLTKSFRKATDWTDTEIKGHALGPDQRQVLFDLLAREVDVRSIVVSCQRRQALGGWAMSNLPEVNLYRRLLCEACEEVSRSSTEPLTITADGGRYKRVDLRRMEDDVRHAAESWSAGRGRTKISFRDSASAPGLQLADVVANTAFRSLGGTPAAIHADALLSPLGRSGRLILRPVTLADCRPTWSINGSNTKAALEGGS